MVRQAQHKRRVELRSCGFEESINPLPFEDEEKI
jgi:hypothetical protein